MNSYICVAIFKLHSTYETCSLVAWAFTNVRLQMASVYPFDQSNPVHYLSAVQRQMAQDLRNGH